MPNEPATPTSPKRGKWKRAASRSSTTTALPPSTLRRELGDKLQLIAGLAPDYLRVFNHLADLILSDVDPS